MTLLKICAGIVAVSGAVTGMLAVWARLFRDPLANWIDARIRVAIDAGVEPLRAELTSALSAASAAQATAAENRTDLEAQTSLIHARIDAERRETHELVAALSGRVDRIIDSRSKP